MTNHSIEMILDRIYSAHKPSVYLILLYGACFFILPQDSEDQKIDLFPNGLKILNVAETMVISLNRRMSLRLEFIHFGHPNTHLAILQSKECFEIGHRMEQKIDFA